MKTKPTFALIKRALLLALLSTLNAQLSTASAQGSLFTYQGHLDDGTNPANGNYDVRFRPFGVITGGSQLTIPDIRSVGVTNGLFTTTLDFGAAIFDGSPVYLQLEVRTNGAAGYTILAPRQYLTPVPYAIFSAQAQTVPTGAIGSAQLANNISLGASNTIGRLDVYRTLAGTPALSLVGSSSQVIAYGDDGQPRSRIDAAGYGGRLTTWDELGNETAHVGSSTNAGGVLWLNQANGNLGLYLDGANSQMNAYYGNGQQLQARVAGASYGGRLTTWDELGNETAHVGSSTDAGGILWLNQANGDLGVYLDGANSQINAYGPGQQLLARVEGASYGGRLTTWDELGNETAHVGSATDAGGVLFLYQRNGNLGLDLDGDVTGTSGGGSVNVHAPDGSSAVFVSGNVSGGGGVYARNTNGNNRALLAGQSTGGGGGLFLYDSSGTTTMALTAAESSTTGSQLVMRQADGTTTIQLDGEFNTGGGGFLRLYKGDGTTGITLQADLNGESRITTQVLQITGGADLSEQFEVKPAGDTLEPGSLVCIDPEVPGQLITSSKAYDRTVAGVMSGAGGVKPGMLMGQQGTAADGKHPVALSGRVYCQADASNGPIHPGDLLTTSNTSGHAMKVTDYDKAHGAIIGKAMSALAKGDGLVLVLVSLQ